ncbi:MAG TPA: enoyl-CoA hydratase-related protein [Patescibacteria group bacterium]|jgi:enoyl-CoA hydratase/carnithine racemase|nr:enoyl-CoA hydratase-related protein [Patescibacteria group bacterium]
MNPTAPRSASSLDFREILYEKGAPIPGAARITINRPERYNAYSTGALLELTQAFGDAALDDSIGVVIYTGAGNRAFCTGGDVVEYADEYVGHPRNYWKYMGFFRRYLESILQSGKPVIARLNGMAVGGGNESQLACDLSLAAEHATLKQVGVHVGSVAAGGATQWLPLAIGDRRARWMLMTGEAVPALQAEEWGLINKAVPSVRQAERWIERATAEQIRAAQEGRDGYRLDLSRLDEEVSSLAKRLLATFPECMRYTKQQVNFHKEFAWNQTIGHAGEWLALHYTHWEPLEGMRAFVEKRRPDYAKLRAAAASGGASETPWGAPLRSCAACGVRDLPEGFTHCGRCGATLGG